MKDTKFVNIQRFEMERQSHARGEPHESYQRNLNKWKLK